LEFFSPSETGSTHFQFDNAGSGSIPRRNRYGCDSGEALEFRFRKIMMEEKSMGFFGDLAKSAAKSVEDRVQKISERKEELERRMEYASDEELFRAIGRTVPMSVEFAALSLMIQERGYSSDEVVRKYNEIKHSR
jgi:hypothetical protein